MWNFKSWFFGLGFFQEERQTVEDVQIKINGCEKANEETTMTRSLRRAEQDEIQSKRTSLCKQNWTEGKENGYKLSQAAKLGNKKMQFFLGIRDKDI